MPAKATPEASAKATVQRVDAILARRMAEDTRIRAVLDEVNAVIETLQARARSLRQALGETGNGNADHQQPAQTATICADCGARVDISEGTPEECPACHASPFEMAR